VLYCVHANMVAHCAYTCRNTAAKASAHAMPPVTHPPPPPLFLPTYTHRFRVFCGGRLWFDSRRGKAGKGGGGLTGAAEGGGVVFTVGAGECSGLRQEVLVEVFADESGGFGGDRLVCVYARACMYVCMYVCMLVCNRPLPALGQRAAYFPIKPIPTPT